VIYFTAIIPSLDNLGSISNKIEEKVSISIVTKGGSHSKKKGVNFHNFGPDTPPPKNCETLTLNLKLKKEVVKFYNICGFNFSKIWKENIFPMKGTLNLNFFVDKIMWTNKKYFPNENIQQHPLKQILLQKEIYPAFNKWGR